MSHKKISILLLILVCAGQLAIAAVVWLVDPYQIWHKRILFKEAGYGSEQLYQHAGWINQVLPDPAENYRAIIIGPSTMSNYTSTMVNEHLDWGKTLNLSYHGGIPSTSSITAEHALRRHPGIKHILWDIHVFYASVDPVYEMNSIFPYYLYNDTVLDDYPYLFNASNLVSGIMFAQGQYPGFGFDIENNGPFYKDLVELKRFETFKSMDYRRNEMLPKLYRLGYAPLDEAGRSSLRYPFVDKYLLATLQPLCNQDIDIRLTFSPHMRYFYASQADKGYVDTLIYMRRYIVNALAECKNVRVYAFDNEDWITTDLDRYADDFHFDPGINQFILSAIAGNRNLLTPDNIAAYESGFMERINAYPDQFAASLNK